MEVTESPIRHKMMELDKATKPLEKLLAENLRMLRGSRTQAEFSEKLDVSVTTYQRLESGRFLPQEETRAQITDKLGISEGRLFADADYVATPEEALEILKKALERQKTLESLTATQRQLLDVLPTLNDRQLRFILEIAHGSVEVPKDAKGKADGGGKSSL